MQIKVTVRYLCPLSGMAEVEQISVPNVGEDEATGTLVCGWWEYKVIKLPLFWKQISSLFKKLNRYLPCDLAIPRK